jgi:peptidoglycan/LPS O-acetylase OafA/YrhL
MNDTTRDRLLRFYVELSAPRARDERGDVPGWVMVTVMTVGLALVIFTFAEEPLKALLTRAFDSVK